MAYKDTGKIIVGTQYLCKLFNVSRDAVGNWRKERGLDCAYVARGKWDLGEAVIWWAETIHYPKASTTIADSRDRWEKARADKLELEYARMRGQMLPRQAVIDQLREYLSVAVGRMYLLPNNAPIFLEGLASNMSGTIRALQEAVKEICDGIAESATIEQIEKRLAQIGENRR